MDDQNVTPEGTPVQLDKALQHDGPVPHSVSSDHNPFRALWDGGYTRLVPIVPPDAVLSTQSSMFRKPESRGKAVGLRGRDGWYGFNWHAYETVRDDCETWRAMGAGVGCRMGEGLVAIDIDALDQSLSLAAMNAAFEIFGPAPRRIGRAPKMLLLYRCTTDIPYRRVEFCGLGGKTERVEILGPGQQAVFLGIHPGTLRPYSWPDGLPARDSLQEITPDQMSDFFQRLVEILPEALATRSSARVRGDVDQDALVGDLDEIKAVVAKIPNDRSDRLWHLRMSYAIKAALRDHPEEAFDLYWSWCERWHDGGKPRVKEYSSAWSHWSTLHAPFTIGADYLFSQASSATGEIQMPADRYFEPVPEGSVDTSNFPALTAPAPVEAIVWIDPASWIGKERPEQQWFVQGLIPDGEVSLLTGKGGIGKSLLVLQLMASVAMGLPFLGRATTQAMSLALFCEDAEDVLHARVKDICASLGIELSDLSANMRVASRKYMDNLLSNWDRSTSQMRCTTLFNQLAQDALAMGAKLVVIDTIADTFGGDEINRQQVRQFIQACAGKLAQAIGGAVILLGHPSKSGEQSGDGTSGSTAWHATVRSRLYLEEAGKKGSGYRKLSSMKANYGPAGDSWMLQWQRGVLELVSSSEATQGVPETESVLQDLILGAVRSANADGVRLALGKTSNFSAERVMRLRDLTGFAPYSAGEVDAVLQKLFATGRIADGTYGKDQNRNRVSTLVVRDNLSGGVFD